MWFVGWPKVLGEEISEKEQVSLRERLARDACIPVFLPDNVREVHFAGFCKGVLWPLFHYVIPQSTDALSLDWDELWQGYSAANLLFAKEVLRHAEEHDTIWVHNYHLMLAPSFLRRRFPHAKIGFFLHIPFPSSDVFRILPAREALLRGVLAADLVGFHTFDYARHFLSACRRVLDLDVSTMPGGSMNIQYSGRDVGILVSHVGARTEAYRELAQTPDVRAQAAAIQARHPGRRIVLAVNELDPVKGVRLKLLAYARLLESFSDWRNKTCLIEVIVSSSNAEAEQASVRASLLEEVASIRSRFGEEVVEVVDHVVSISEITAYFLAADVAVISSLWDGLNLIPFAYTAAQDDDNPGVLVLSEFMGCTRSLSGVIRVNPWALESFADALRTALEMPIQERIAKHARRARFVAEYSVTRWARGFLDELEVVSRRCQALNFVQVGWGSNLRLVGFATDFRRLETSQIVNSYASCRQRLFLLDYDGTLTAGGGEVSGPPTDTVARALRALSADPHNTVFILSGRKRDVLGAWFADLTDLGLAAEKGCFIRFPRKSAWKEMTVDSEFWWKTMCTDIIRSYTERTDGTWVEDKESAIVWHYEAADPEYGRMQAVELIKVLTEAVDKEAVTVVEYAAARVVEVRPLNVDKGRTAQLLLDSMSRARTGPPPFLLAVGDEVADEDTFRAVEDYTEEVLAPAVDGRTELLHTFTCCVGMKPSRAHYFLHSPDDVVDMLVALAAAGQET